MTRGLWGPGNIGNLHVLESARGHGIVILDDRQEGEGAWDFTGGEAAAALSRLAADGAIIVRDIPSALAAVAAITREGPCRS